MKTQRFQLFLFQYLNPNRKGQCTSVRHWVGRCWVALLAIGWLAMLGSPASGSHRTHEGDTFPERSMTTGHPIPGAPFQVFWGKGEFGAEGANFDHTHALKAIHTVVDALSQMIQHRTQYKRFDEALTKDLLQKVLIEHRVVNRDGKEFPFLVVRTKHKGKVQLLISASMLEKNGYFTHPKKLIPSLAREFQWVVSKASTAPRFNRVRIRRDLQKVPIHTNKDIRAMSGNERLQGLQRLFATYLTTEDDHQSLKGQPYYEVGSTTLTRPTHQDETTRLYDIRVREALELIVREPFFQEHTQRAVRSLLNGKVWNVAFVNIDDRDWATRTRVAMKDNAVSVGERGTPIQPAKVLVNYHRIAAPEDSFYPDTMGLPMGALSADQLARAIAWEIQTNIVEKSMRGHVAQDEQSAPK